jgi:hypothetical protein
MPCHLLTRTALHRKETHKDKALRKQHEQEARELFTKYGVRCTAARVPVPWPGAGR